MRFDVIKSCAVGLFKGTADSNYFRRGSGNKGKGTHIGGLRKVELGILEGGILFTRSCATPVKYLLNCSAIDWLSVILRPLIVSWDIFESGGLSRRIVLIVCQVCLRSSLNLANCMV